MTIVASTKLLYKKLESSLLDSLSLSIASYVYVHARANRRLWHRACRIECSTCMYIRKYMYVVRTVGVNKKFPSPVRTTGRAIPFRTTGRAIPFHSRLTSVRLPFLSVFKPFPFCPTGSPSVQVNGPYDVIKHAQSLIAVISAGRLATVQ